MKRGIALCLAAVMTFSLTACQGKDTAGNTQGISGETAAQGEQEKDTSKTDAAQQKAETESEQQLSQEAVNLEGFDEDWTYTDVGKKKIGIVPWSMAQEFNSTCAETSKRLCEQLGWEATVYDPDGDWTKMQQNIEDLIIQGVDGIIFTAIDTVAASSLVDRVHEAGILIVDYDCCASEGNADMDVVYNDYLGGQMAAEEAMKALEGVEKPTIVMFEAEPSIMTSGLRNNGFIDYIKENHPEVELVQNRTTDRTNDGCYQWALDMYAAYPDVDLFFCNWGDCATSVWYALQSASATDVYVIGYDATSSHLEIMRNEGPDCTFYASIAMFPEVYARTCVQKLNEIWAETYQRKDAADQVVIMPEVLRASEAADWKH